jgi:hypothetical protein
MFDSTGTVSLSSIVLDSSVHTRERAHPLSMFTHDGLYVDSSGPSQSQYTSSGCSPILEGGKLSCFWLYCVGLLPLVGRIYFVHVESILVHIHNVNHGIKEAAFKIDVEEETEIYFKGYTVFSATVNQCRRLQLTFLAQGYWVGNPMVFMEGFINECLSLVPAQDLGSKFHFTSDHWLKRCNPLLER